jgi:hypothetical protein
MGSKFKVNKAKDGHSDCKIYQYIGKHTVRKTKTDSASLHSAELGGFTAYRH